MSNPSSSPHPPHHRSALNGAKNSINPTEEFKRQIVSTSRAISGDDGLEVVFSNQKQAVKPNQIRVSMPNSRSVKDPQQRQLMRGEADLNAIIHAHHNARLCGQFAPTHPQAAALFHALEEARYESLGARHKAGIADNLDAFLHQNLQNAGVFSQRIPMDDNLPIAMKYLAKQAIAGRTPPEELQPLLKAWQDKLPKQTLDLLTQLQPFLDDQAEFSRQAVMLLQKINLASNMEEPELNEEDESPQDDAAQDDNQIRGQSEESSDDEERQSSQDGGESEEGEANSIEIDDELAEPIDALHEGEDDTQPVEWCPEHGFDSANRDKNYVVFTKEHDRIVAPDELATGEELQQLRDLLDKQLENFQTIVSKLANRLQRKLMVQQQRSWEFDLEEGYLNTARLTRIITDPTRQLSYKQEKDTEFKDTMVTLLIDNSGSMRGRPISIASVCADILARTLERCRVKVEILGFTTMAWKGGKSRE